MLGAIAYGGRLGYDYFTVGRFIMETDDAYVGADTAIIAAKISGHIVEVAVDQNQRVHAGDLLARIDPVDYQLAVDAAKAKIDTQDATVARIGRQIDAQKAVISQAEAQVALAQAQADSAEADHQRAELEYQRSQKLADAAFGSQQRLEQAAADRARTTASMAGSKAQTASAEASLAGAKANLDVLQSQQVEAQRVRAELVTTKEKAERDLTFTEIRAPFDGVVGNKAVELGQYAQPGVRLMALVAMDSVYVDANFKETQLGNIRPGQRVEISVDAFGGRTVVRRRQVGRAGFRRAVRADPARQRDRQFHQGRAAHSRAHHARRRRDQGRRAAPRPVGRSPPCTRAATTSRSRRCSARSASAKRRVRERRRRRLRRPFPSSACALSGAGRAGDSGRPAS